MEQILAGSCILFALGHRTFLRVLKLLNRLLLYGSFENLMHWYPGYSLHGKRVQTFDKIRNLIIWQAAQAPYYIVILFLVFLVI